MARNIATCGKPVGLWSLWGMMAGDETDWDCSHCILPITGGTGNQSQSGGRRCQTGSQSQLGQCQTDSQSQCTVGQNLKQGG